MGAIDQYWLDQIWDLVGKYFQADQEGDDRASFQFLTLLKRIGVPHEECSFGRVRAGKNGNYLRLRRVDFFLRRPAVEVEFDEREI